MAAMRSGSSALDDGQCSRTGSEVSEAGGNGFMLFGVRVLTEGSFRKSVSMNNLAQYDQLPQDSSNDAAAGYASDDVVHPSGRSRERKRGVPWSEEEHRLFLLGLQKVGKGDWRGISRNYVKTRTPTQVASHAQKYFLRRNNHNRRRRRSSLFDITTDAVVGSAIDDQMYQENLSQQPPTIQQPKMSKNLEKFPMPNFPASVTPVALPIAAETPMENLTLGQVNQLNNSPKPIRPIPILPVPPSSKMANLNLNKTNTILSHEPPPSLSLNLSISSSPPSDQEPPPPSSQQSPPPAAARHASAFQAMPAGFNGSGGDSMISVA
ncbi:myb-like transcription factor family protein [Perilla frutescens var. hirtella]|uniref:Myb-like transcription factor family protein n=1 Tax=Perilla frutescens var. hirtella TaxID=608512 RepID=A0AAD4IPC1_PERFH|nr:myb-like transcription factor family protein [Perilla frutescens var. hirtella]